MNKILIYLHIMHLLKSSACFEHYPVHLQEVPVVIVYMQPLVSSLSTGLVHRLRKKGSFLTGAQDSHLQLEINQGYTTMHGQPFIKICLPHV